MSIADDIRAAAFSRQPTDIEDVLCTILMTDAELAMKAWPGDQYRTFMLIVAESFDDESKRERRYKAALIWALGAGGEFPARKEGQGAYWWRMELQARAGLEWDGKKFIPGEVGWMVRPERLHRSAVPSGVLGGPIGAPVTVTFGPMPPKGPCTVCGKSLAMHGSYPTCATHPFTDDANCKYLLGARCPGTECVNGCAHSSAAAVGVAEKKKD